MYKRQVENRWLDDIRSSLLDPKCEGPDIVYSIAMEVGKTVHKALLQKQHLLFGVVAYAKGSLGMEDVYKRQVLDIDSDDLGGFDETDARFLEEMIKML